MSIKNLFFKLSSRNKEHSTTKSRKWNKENPKKKKEYIVFPIISTYMCFYFKVLIIHSNVHPLSSCLCLLIWSYHCLRLQGTSLEISMKLLLSWNEPIKFCLLNIWLGTRPRPVVYIHINFSDSHWFSGSELGPFFLHGVVLSLTDKFLILIPFSHQDLVVFLLFRVFIILPFFCTNI